MNYLERPKVSLITTTYNCFDSVQKAIDSAIEQDYPIDEMIIVDDGSTDETWKIIANQLDPRIRLIRSERVGRAKALNVAWRECRNAWIANLDADDWCERDRISRQMVEISNRERSSDLRVGVFGSAYYQVFGDGTRVRRTYPLENESCRRALATYGPFCHSSVIYRKDALVAVGGFDETLPCRIDMDCWIRIAAAGFGLGNLEAATTFHVKSPHTFFMRNSSRWQRTKMMHRCNVKAIKSLRLPIRYHFICAARLFWSLFPERLRSPLRFLGGLRDVQIEPVSSADEAP